MPRDAVSIRRIRLRDTERCRGKKSSKTFHYLLVLFSLLALYGKLLREDGVFYRS